MVTTETVTTPATEPLVEVHGSDILNAYTTITKYDIRKGLQIAKFAIIRALSLLYSVFSILISLIMAAPFYIVILAVIILLTVFWNEAIKPLCEYIIIAINGIIDGYNGMVDFEVGFDMGDFGGYTRLFGFSDFLPRASRVGADIPEFIPFVKGILIPALFLPIKQKLTGIIFA